MGKPRWSLHRISPWSLRRLELFSSIFVLWFARTRTQTQIDISSTIVSTHFHQGRTPQTLIAFLRYAFECCSAPSVISSHEYVHLSCVVAVLSEECPRDTKPETKRCYLSWTRKGSRVLTSGGRCLHGQHPNTTHIGPMVSIRLTCPPMRTPKMNVTSTSNDANLTGVENWKHHDAPRVAFVMSVSLVCLQRQMAVSAKTSLVGPVWAGLCKVTQET